MASNTTTLGGGAAQSGTATSGSSSSSTLPPASFSTYISDAQLSIASRGFSTTLWSPEHGWVAEEAEASENPHPPQELAALKCFIAFFVSTVARCWVHLAAEMQAGKTGVVSALIRLILTPTNFRKIGIAPKRIFVLTGMNDNAWRKQTRNRLPDSIRSNVYHNGGLAKFVKAIKALAVDSELRNVLVVIDESHIASCVDNRPQKLIYDTLAELCPQAKWVKNNIRFLTISATDPAKVLSIRDSNEAAVVRLQTTKRYQSIEKLAAASRIRWLELFGDLHQDKGIAELKRCITEEFSDEPRYHIIRARSGKTDAVIKKLETAFPGAPIRKFDSDKTSASTDDGSSNLSDIADINEIISEKPDQHTFIVIKNMLYAAKTLDDEFVGVLWDRLGGKDDTNLQSLLGRACGYGKSSRTIVYTAKATVENYQTLWRELCSSSRMDPVLSGVPVSKVAKLSKRMPGVTAKRFPSGAGLSASPRAADPLGSSAAAAAAGAGGGVPLRRTTHSSVSHLEEFPTMDLLRRRWAEIIAGSGQSARSPSTPHQRDGKYICSIGGRSDPQSAQAIRAKFGGDSTSNWGSGITTAAPGEYIHRVLVGYDEDTVVFFLRWTKKD